MDDMDTDSGHENDKHNKCEARKENATAEQRAWSTSVNNDDSEADMPMNDSDCFMRVGANNNYSLQATPHV